MPDFTANRAARSRLRLPHSVRVVENRPLWVRCTRTASSTGPGVSLQTSEAGIVQAPLFLLKLLIRTGLAGWLPSLRRCRADAAFLRYYSNRLLMSPLRELERFALELEAPSAEVIDLGHGSPRFDLLPSASTKLPEDRRGWPPLFGAAELLSAVADKLRRDNRLEFHPADEIQITAGALGALQTVLDAFVNRGDRVVLFDPCSPLYPLLVRTRQARVHWLPTWMDNGRTRFRLDQLAHALRGARLLILNSPANPSGGTIAVEDLEQLLWWAERHDVLVLSDESLERYHYDGPPTSLASMPGARRRTLTAGSVSKGYALASARVGWLAAERGLLRPCRLTAALRSPFVTTLSQQIALAALRSDPGEFQPIRAELESRRRYVFERLQAMDLNPAWPAGGFFFWVPVWDKGYRGQRLAEELLQQCQVRVSPGDLYGPSGIGYVRISYAIDDGRVQEGLNRLSDYLQGVRDSIAPSDRSLAA